MYRLGVLALGQEVYAVHEITERGYKRVDITQPTALFQTQPELVLYSRVQTRGRIFYKGDSKFYDEYKLCLYGLDTVRGEKTVEKEWTEQGYTTTTITVNEKEQIRAKVSTVNGQTTAVEYSSPTRVLSLDVAATVYDVKVPPLDFKYYDELNVTEMSDHDTSIPYFPLSVLRKRYDIAHLDAEDFVVADTVEEATARLNRWAKADAPIKGFDTETTGTEVHMVGKDHLVGIILAYSEHESTYFPFGHVSGLDNLPRTFLDKLMKIVIRQQDRLVAHNKKFDQQVMRKEGYNLRIKHDTMILSIILNSVLIKGAHALKELILKLNGKYYLELTDIFTSPKLIDFSVLPKDIVRAYACPDGSNVIALFNDLIKKLPKFQYPLYEYECRLADIIVDHEYYGMRVDVKKFARNCENNNYVLDMLLKSFRMLTHEDGNISSSAVLGNLLYNKMGCPILSRTKTGKPSTSSAAVNKLASQKAEKVGHMQTDLIDKFGRVVISAEKLNNSKYPALLILSKYKEYIKRKTAFYARFERTMQTGRIFFWVNQNGAASGRQSSPMHQLPPELKDVILSDSDDHDLSGPDYSQIELRIIAWLAGEKDLVAKCCDPSNDIHRIIDSLISGLPMWAITSKMRSAHKRRNFGVVYLISEYGLAGQNYGPGYSTEQVKEAKQQLDDFYNRFKRIKRFIRQNGEFVSKNYYMQTSILGRRRHFPELARADLTSRQRSSYVRQANNMPVQGTAADLMKIALVNMQEFIEAKGWDKVVNGYPLVRLMLSIHDEVLISHHKSIPYEEIMEMIKVCMEVKFEDAPPFFSSPAKMSSWGDHTNDAIVVPVQLRDKLIADYNKTKKSVFKRSYFKLNIDDQTVVAIEKDAQTYITSSVVKKYLDKVEFKYMYGDWHTELTQEERVDALTRYVDSGFTEYSSENYLDVLNSYRDGELRDYMQSLIDEYGEDVKALSDHVRHPTLTHDLIDKASKEIKNKEKSIGQDLTQEECIYIATEKYLKELHKDNTAKSTAVSEPLTMIAREDEDRHEKFFEESEALVNFDQDGNIVFQSAEDEMDYSDDISVYDDEEFIEEMCEGKVILVWETAYEYVVDCSNVDAAGANKVLAYIHSHSVPDGFYGVSMLYANQILDTKMRVEDLDKVELSNMIVQLQGGVLV